MRTVIIIFLFFTSKLFGQTSYKGFIGKFPIELVTHIYSDGDARAIYAYTNFDNPIIINGRLEKSNLALFEKDTQGNITATFTFENFDVKSNVLTGSWEDLKTKKTYQITLSKEFTIDYGYEITWENQEILQPVSLKDQYFKLIVSKTKDDFEARVTGVKIFEKKTDRLIQQIHMDCQLVGLDNISTDDYNFDGLPDFAVFESSYAGPNTSSLYFLYNPVTKEFFNSEFSGTSLEFDKDKKCVYEHNQCCAGTSHTTAVFKVVNNKMVLIEQHCYKWDEDKQELVERRMSECQ